MLPGMNADEAKQVLAAARDSAQMGRWQEIHDLLHKVHEQNLLTGADQGDAAYLLGLAAMATNDWTGASTLLTEASSSAGPEYRAEAKQRLVELGHHDGAVAAEADQEVDQKESTAVLAAADEAVARGDYDGALVHYTAVYDGHADPGPRAKGALGIATVLAHKNDLAQAKQYAEYVVGTGVADAAAAAKTLLDWIATEQNALTAAADGTTLNEYAAANEAAKAAIYGDDFEHGRTLLMSMLNSPQLGTVERAKAAVNLAYAEIRLGMYDDARINAEMAATHGIATTVEKAQRLLGMLDRHDHAEELVMELED